MKRKFLLVLFITNALLTFGQQITYQILEDEPTKAYTKFIAPEVGMDYNSAALSVFVGANGRFGISDLLTVEGAFRYDLYNGIDAIGGTFGTEAGIYLPFTQSIRQKEIPVMLSYNPYAGTEYKDGKKYNIEEAKFIKVPSGQYLNQLGMRGGVHYRKLGAQDMTYTTTSPINLGGFYLGGQFTSQAYVKTRINDDVERIGAGFTRIFIDAFILPISEIQNPAADEGVKSDGTFGWRAGFQWFASPHDGDYRFLGPSIFTIEVGSKPLTGFNFMFSYGFAFMNRR